MRHDKLVRDRIPSIIVAKGGTATHYPVADDAEYQRRLRAKLQEEVEEFLESEDPAELADILEVVDAIAEAHGIGWRGIMRMKREKREERGGFRRRIILEEAFDAP